MLTHRSLRAERIRHTVMVAMLVVVLVLVLSACAADANTEVSDAANAPGFFYGLWHGLILPFTFVISLFEDTVGIYEIDNNGHWYDLGFLLGVGGLGLPGILSARRR